MISLSLMPDVRNRTNPFTEVAATQFNLPCLDPFIIIYKSLIQLSMWSQVVAGSLVITSVIYDFSVQVKRKIRKKRKLAKNVQ